MNTPEKVVERIAKLIRDDVDEDEFNDESMNVMPSICHLLSIFSSQCLIGDLRMTGIIIENKHNMIVDTM